MIKHSDFIQLLNTLLQSYDGSNVTDTAGISDPKNLYLIDKVQHQIKDKKFVIIEQETNGLNLKFKNNRNQFLIKKADLGKVDPPLYFKENNKWELDFKTSSVILLTDFAFYLYQNATHKLLRSDFKIFDTVQDHFKVICRDVDCFSEIWFYSKLNCFALVDRVEEKIYFVSNTAENIYQLNALFPEVPEKKAKKEKFVASDFLTDTYIEDNDLHGNAKIAGIAEPVELIFESKKKKTDFSKDLDFAKKFISKLTKKKQDQLLDQVAEEITDAAFAQSEKINKKKPLADLRKDLRISQLIFVEGDVLLNIQSQQVFPNKEIMVQLDEELEVVEVTIPEVEEME